jgi:hypothetical protein
MSHLVPLLESNHIALDYPLANHIPLKTSVEAFRYEITKNTVAPFCYWLLGVGVGDGFAAGVGVRFQVIIRNFQASPSRTAIDEK